MLNYCKYNKSNNLKKGKEGENIAANYIKFIKKEKIIVRNFKCLYGEIDIISYKNKNIFIYEIKYRLSNTFKFGELSITNKKIERIINAYQIWINQNPKFSKFDFHLQALVIDSNLKINEFTIY